MRTRLGLILILLSSQGYAQWIQEKPAEDVELRSETYANSNTVNQHFINALFFELEVDEQDIEQNLKRIRSNASLGVISMHSLSAKLGRLPLSLNIADHRYAAFQGPVELISMALQGNAAFEGDTVTLENTKYHIQAFQEIGLSYFFEQSSGPLCFNVSYLNAGIGEFGSIRSGGFYTASLGSELWLKLDADFLSSDTLSRQLLPSNGHGFSIGFRKDWTQLSKEHDLGAFVSVQNLGFICWRSSSTHRSIDRQYRLSPFDYDLSNTESEIIQFVLQDTIDSYAPERNKALNRLTPFRLDVGIRHEAHSTHAVWKNNRAFGAQYIYLAGYAPRFWYREYFSLSSQLEAFASTGFGGFGSVFLGLGMRAELDKITLAGNISNIEGMLLPNQTAGLGASFQISYSF